MTKILIADPLAEEGMKKIQSTPGISAEVRPGLTEEELAGLVGEYDGMIIRSGVKITARVMEKPGRLRCIARAGVGVDNVDLEAATKAGILVMNTPDANTISTAEQTMALMLALTRKVPAADAHVRSGEWKRGQFTGLQLAGKTLGIVGLGRVGRAVAQRALAFDMKVLAYDPFFSGQTALDGKVTMVSRVDDLLPQCDYLTLHTVASAETKGMINKSTIDRMKHGVRIVNCARGAGQRGRPGRSAQEWQGGGGGDRRVRQRAARGQPAARGAEHGARPAPGCLDRGSTARGDDRRGRCPARLSRARPDPLGGQRRRPAVPALAAR